MKKILGFLVVVFLVLGMTGCSKKKAGAAEEFFILGVQQPLSGDMAVAGQSALRGIQLGVERINAKGGFQGRQVKLAVYDDQGSPEEAVKVANKLVEIDKANAVIGSLISSNLLASGRNLEEAKILTIGIGLSPTWMSQGWKYFFRANMNTDVSTPSVVDSLEALGMKSVALFRGEDDAAMTGAVAFRKECEKRGVPILIDTSFTYGDTDFSGQIAAMLNQKPDTIYMCTLNYMLGTFMKQLRGFGFKGLVFSKEVFTTDQLFVSQQDTNNYIFSAPYVSYPDLESCKEDNMRAYMELYQNAYGELPSQDPAFRAWDAMLALDAAMQVTTSFKPEDMREAMYTVKDVKALGGTLDFTDRTGEGLPSVRTFIIQDMNFLTLDSWLADGGFERFKAAQ
jgi:branched-chain amino acid transport system substrate-binding protein